MKSSLCPCGSGESYQQCCEAFIKGTRLPETAEKLMRSRYTAFTLADIRYLEKTLAPESRGDFDSEATGRWAKESEWKGLKILSTEKGTASDREGVVEFIASYHVNDQDVKHHEVSTFRKDETGQWLFVDGHDPDQAKPKTVVREAPKVGRNDPCTCGSGKKYKKCCGQ